MLKAGTAARRRTVHWLEPRSPEATRALVTELLGAIGERLKAVNPQWIGHVKIMIAGGGEACYCSLTAAVDQPHWAGALQRDIADAELTVYAAIYSLSDAQVAQAVDETLAAEQLAG